MEFTGEITFADESQWLTLTTDTDDTVTVSVSVDGESLSFTVTPSSGVTRLPVGEIVRTLAGGGSLVNLTVTATQGAESCSYTATVFPCRKFTYTTLGTAVFSGRPKTSTVYSGEKDNISFLNSSAQGSAAYIRFIYRSGSKSAAYPLSQSSGTPKIYSLDISYDTAISIASGKGLDTSSVTGYEVWIATSSTKGDIYTCNIGAAKLSMRTYKFLGTRGTYEYIHATGPFGRSVETETTVFIESGSVERELGNDSSMRFEQNSGYIGSAGEGSFWLQFFSSKERYAVESDGAERLIVIDDCDQSLTDLEIGEVSFTWHYANPNNTVTDKTVVAITGLSVSGASSVNDSGNSTKYTVTYTPTTTTQRGVNWSIVSGSAYASIDQAGNLTVKSGASASNVVVRATSVYDSSIYAEKTVKVTYVSTAPSITFGSNSISVTAAGGTVTNTVTTENLTGLTVSASGTMGLTATISNGQVTLTCAANTATSAKAATVTVSGTRTDGGGSYSRSFTVTQAAAEAEVVNPSIDSTSFVLSGEGASRTLNVSDPQLRGWRLTSSAAWATLSQSSGTGAAAVTVTAAASTSTTATRTGYVYLWDSTGATKLATLTLTQAPTSVVALTGLAISGEDTGDYGVYLTAVYTPSDTTQTGVQWSIVSGSDYASIGANEGGDEITVTINPVGNVGKTFTVRCTSTANSAIYAEKTITIVEGTVADWSIAGPTALTAYSSEEYQYSVDWGDIIEQDVTWSVENAGTSAYPYATINSSTGVLKQGLKAYQMSSGSSGTFQVRATLADGEYKEIDVTITKK